MQTGQHVANVGSRLKRVKARKAPSEKPAFQPYRGKPAVRNERGDRGNVGIIRSPLRASILPDRLLRLYGRGAWGANRRSALRRFARQGRNKTIAAVDRRTLAAR